MDKVSELEDEYEENLARHHTEEADEELDWEDYSLDDKEDFVINGLETQGYEVYPVQVIDRYWEQE